MEELQPEDIGELLQELEEEYGAQESLPEEVEELLHVLQSSSAALDRRDAAEQLGNLETSSPRIVRGLIAAYGSDPYSMVNRAAAKSLRAPVHQEYLQENPDLMGVTERALQQGPGADRQPPEPERRTPQATERPAPDKQRYRPWDLRRRRRKEAYEGYSRRKPVSNLHIGLMIAAGVFLLGIGIAGVRAGLRDAVWAMLVLPCLLLCTLPGVALLGWALWNWLAPWGARNVFRRSMKETSAEVSRAWRKEHTSEGRTTYKYFVTVSLRADDVQGGGRDILLKLQVTERIWESLEAGTTVTARYAAKDPRITLIQGE
jgi:hypothetical protein